jgi:hypothetical protein
MAGIPTDKDEHYAIQTNDYNFVRLGVSGFDVDAGICAGLRQLFEAWGSLLALRRELFQLGPSGPMAAVSK